MIKVLITEDSVDQGKDGYIYKLIIQSVEKPLIEHILERTAGNQLMAARILGINRNTIRSKIRKLGIDSKKWKTTQ